MTPRTQEPSQGAGQTRPGELREVVRLVEAVQGFPPTAPVDEVVPLRDEVVDRAAAGHARHEMAGVAKGGAAVHAARALFGQVLFGGFDLEFVPILDPLQWIGFGEWFAVRLREILLVFP
jgi:hypothetical protein